jgi:hypothetical protein
MEPFCVDNEANKGIDINKNFISFVIMNFSNATKSHGIKAKANISGLKTILWATLIGK